VKPRLLPFVIIVVALGATVVGYAAFRGAEPGAGTAPSRWREVAWQFPIDQWGTGKTFSCGRADCGHEVSLHLRAKLGSCDCTRGVADDDDLNRMSDFDLLGSEVSPLAPGRPIKVGIMKGRMRAYAVTASGEQTRNAISVVVNDRCDMIVATAVLPRNRLEKVEPAVIEFLNSPTILRWAEAAIGL
jgi:hypothetical protein